MKKLDIPAIFKLDADDILRVRQNAIMVHGTDIRAAGNDVEMCVRDYFKRMLPPRYYVTHGHLIDISGEVSPQLDIIIADNFNLPSLLTTKDGTEYIPIDSVYAIGEIKSTYYKSKKYIEGFSQTIQDIRTRLFHEDIINTAYGSEISDETLLRDIYLQKENRILNRIFSFILCVDAGDFKFEDIAPFYLNRNKSFLPNMTTLLTSGVISYARFDERGLGFVRCPEDEQGENYDWYFSPCVGTETGSFAGNHLGVLYCDLLNHLTNSYLELPSLTRYIATMRTGRKSLTKKAGDV